MPPDPADTYESADANPDVSEFPLDTSSTGKHYQVAVPDFRQNMQSYFRHGVPHSGASQHTGGAWKPTGDAKKLGDDLLRGIKPPEGFDTALGGVRDHTDGNRIVTTRLDMIEVVGGQYRRLVLNFQDPLSEEDPDWKPPTEGGPQEPDIIEHIYPTYLYEVTSTTHQPAAGSFSEPRKKVHEAWETDKLDIYEYTNGKQFYEVIAAEQHVTEKTYGGTIYGVASAIHKDHPEWESTLDDDGHGGSRPFTIDNNNQADHFDIAEMLYGHRLLEIARASDYFEERLVCDDGDFLIVLGASRSKGTFTDKTWGFNIVMEEQATHNITVTADAGNDISETMTAGGTIKERTTADTIDGETHAGVEIKEITTAAGPITEVTACGGPITEVSATTAQFDFSAAAFMLELTAAALKVEIDLGIRIECTIGPEKIEFHNGHKVQATATKTELTEMKTRVEGDIHALQLAVTDISGGEYMFISPLFEVL